MEVLLTVIWLIGFVVTAWVKYERNSGFDSLAVLYPVALLWPLYLAYYFFDTRAANAGRRL